MQEWMRRRSCVNRLASVVVRTTGAVHMRFSRGRTEGDGDAFACRRLGCRRCVFVLTIGPMHMGLGLGCVRMTRMAMIVAVPMPM